MIHGAWSARLRTPRPLQPLASRPSWSIPTHPRCRSALTGGAILPTATVSRCRGHRTDDRITALSWTGNDGQYLGLPRADLGSPALCGDTMGSAVGSRSCNWPRPSTFFRPVKPEDETLIGGSRAFFLRPEVVDFGHEGAVGAAFGACRHRDCHGLQRAGSGCPYEPTGRAACLASDGGMQPERE